MQAITVKTYSDNLYNAADNSKFHNVLFFEANHVSSVTIDVAAKQIMEMVVISAATQNILQLSYDELKQIQPLMDEMAKKYKERKVVISDKLCTLVPESLLNVVETEAYQQLNHPILPNSQVLYCKLHVQQTAVLFNVRNELVKLIRFNLPMSEVIHGSLLFIKAVEQQQFSDASNKLHLHIHPGYIEILCIDQQIRFYNTFPFETETEIVYYLLAAAEQLQISHSCDVVLYGNSPILSALHTLIGKYVRNVQFAIKPKNFTFPGTFKEFSEHQFFTEASALLCE